MLQVLYQRLSPSGDGGRWCSYNTHPKSSGIAKLLSCPGLNNHHATHHFAAHHTITHDTAKHRLEGTIPIIRGTTAKQLLFEHLVASCLNPPVLHCHTSHCYTPHSARHHSATYCSTTHHTTRHPTAIHQSLPHITLECIILPHITPCHTSHCSTSYTSTVFSSAPSRGRRSTPLVDQLDFFGGCGQFYFQRSAL